MATPVKDGGGGHGHHHVQGNSADKGKKGEKKRKHEGEGAGAAGEVTVAHIDKKSKAPTLSKEHQDYVTSFITELHSTATTSYNVTRAANLTAFFIGRKDEMLAKRDEKLSSVAAFRFVFTQPDLKEKAIKGFEALDMLSWGALQLAVSSTYDPTAEPRIREEIEAFCAEDSIARENDWNKEVIMAHVTGKNPKALVKHIFPSANIS